MTTSEEKPEDEQQFNESMAGGELEQGEKSMVRENRLEFSNKYRFNQDITDPKTSLGMEIRKQ